MPINYETVYFKEIFLWLTLLTFLKAVYIHVTTIIIPQYP